MKLKGFVELIVGWSDSQILSDLQTDDYKQIMFSIFACKQRCMTLQEKHNIPL